MQRITTYLLRSAAMVMAVLFSVSCTKDDAPHYPHASRVVLVYMAGDNSLGGYVWDNLDAMRRGMASAPAGSRTIAYVDTPDGNPRLLEVTSSGTQILYTWPSVHNSASAATVCEVVSLVRTLAPADRYGLVLWSHGLAWMPSWATGYLTRSKARIGDIWPQTKHDGAASETSVFFNPAARPASAPASVTATGSAPDDRSIPTVSVPTFRPTAKHDGMLYASFASSMRPVPGFGPVAAGRDTGSGGIPSSVRSSSAERIAPAMPASCVAFPFVGDAFPHRPVPALRFDTVTGYVSGIPAGMIRAVPACPAIFPVSSATAPWPATKWFGQDTSESPAGYLDTEQLSEAIPSGVFDWILFDACFMASAETLYALRDKADRIVCSPAEVIADGFPYAEIMAELLRPEPDLKAVCESYYRHYAEHAQSSYRSATVSLIETSQLEALAAATASVLGTALTADPEVLSDMDLNRLQPLDRYRRHFLFDAGSVVGELETRSLVPASLAGAWRSHLARTVIYEAHTPTMLGLALDECCGLSMYVPVGAYADLNEYYRTLEWYARCYPADYSI